MVVKFYATLRDIVGGRTVEFNLVEGSTVRDLVNEIINYYPSLRREMLDNNGNLYPHVHIFVNGRDAPYLENALDTPLSMDDSIDIFPAVGGG